MSKKLAASQFSTTILRWQASHGRTSLPWQNTCDPYRVWLSEIMLQQTQVATVLAYYARFLQRFPTVVELAAAEEDEVLGLWSGLGYYSRARNLHRCAREIVTDRGGMFPGTAEELMTLPGIGRSTAAAIASFCFGERVAILDGNVKRVLTRVLGFTDDLAFKVSESALWKRATDLLPTVDLRETMPRYTQGLMDLGATVCSARRPQCLLCPVQTLCVARLDGNPEKYPVKTQRSKRSEQSLSLLWAHRSDGAIWLERRPASGIWGGLFCFPVFSGDDAMTAALPAVLRDQLIPLPKFVHVLTHKDLHLATSRLPVAERLTVAPIAASDHSCKPSAGSWFAAAEWAKLGLPAPIRRLLQEGMASQTSG